MEYLTLFNNFDEFAEFFTEKNFELPCVGYVQNENYVHYFKDYETFPTNLIYGESYPNLVAFFKKIIAELDLNFDINNYYSIDLHGNNNLSNEIDVTGYGWYDYLLSLQIGYIDSATGAFIGLSIPYIMLYDNRVSFGNDTLDFTTNTLYASEA